MRLNSKGQVTIPADLRHKHGLREGDEIDVVEHDGSLRIVRSEQGASRGRRIVSRLRATVKLSTDEVMRLTRGE